MSLLAKWLVLSPAPASTPCCCVSPNLFYCGSAQLMLVPRSMFRVFVMFLLIIKNYLISYSDLYLGLALIAKIPAFTPLSIPCHHTDLLRRFMVVSATILQNYPMPPSHETFRGIVEVFKIWPTPPKNIWGCRSSCWGAACPHASASVPAVCGCVCFCVVSDAVWSCDCVVLSSSTPKTPQTLTHQPIDPLFSADNLDPP